MPLSVSSERCRVILWRHVHHFSKESWPVGRMCIMVWNDCYGFCFFWQSKCMLVKLCDELEKERSWWWLLFKKIEQDVRKRTLSSYSPLPLKSRSNFAFFKQQCQVVCEESALNFKLECMDSYCKSYVCGLLVLLSKLFFEKTNAFWNLMQLLFTWFLTKCHKLNITLLMLLRS